MTRTIAAIAAGMFAVAAGGVIDRAAVAEDVAKDLTVGRYVVARVRVPAAGYSVEKRAEIVRDRVLTILSDASLTPENIAKAVSVRKSGTDRALYVGKNLFFTITPADAEATHATVDQLAKMWADNLRAALPKTKPRPKPESAAESQ